MSKHPSDAVEAVLAKVEDEAKAMIGLARKMLEAYDGAIYGFDLLANAAVDRSLALSAGFCLLIRERNLTCAGALIRLQLDTALRFIAGFTVDNPHEFAISVFEGKRIDRMKDRHGKLMTDRHLVTKLAEEYPWIPTVYERTSGYVHMSGTHILSTLDVIDRDARIIGVKMSSRDQTLPDAVYLDTVNTFRACTRIFARYIDGWIWTKNNPDKVAQMKESAAWPPSGAPSHRCTAANRGQRAPN